MVACQKLFGTLGGDEVTEFDTPLGGLSSNEAEIRLEKYGENKLREPEKTSAFIRFLSQPRPLNYLLIGAGLSHSQLTRPAGRCYFHWDCSNLECFLWFLARKQSRARNGCTKANDNFAMRCLS